MKGDKAGSSKKGTSTSRVLQSENVHSLNHLYQLAAYSALQAATLDKSLGVAITRSVQVQALTRKATLRLDPTIKRSQCKRCSLPMLPGLTSRSKIRTPHPSSRALELICLVCSQRHRTIVPSSSADHDKKIAVKHRRKQTRLERDRLSRKLTQISGRNASQLNKTAVKVSQDRQNRHASSQRWSQRSRRRAGRIKVRMMREGGVVDLKDSDMTDSTSRGDALQGSSSTLPKYTDRLIDSFPQWDKSWPQNTILAEKEVIRTLRGGHLITSGLGRGGTTGAEIHG